MCRFDQPVQEVVQAKCPVAHVERERVSALDLLDAGQLVRNPLPLRFEVRFHRFRQVFEDDGRDRRHRRQAVVPVHPPHAP
jgi:hypothetical protein